MKSKTLLLVLASLVVEGAVAEEAKVTELVSRELKESPGREGLMIAVEYPPGSSDPIHRHNAHSFVYMLEGSAVMQVKGGKQVTLSAGQTFYEGPDDIHVVGRNASSTKPAKLLVFLVKDQRRSGASADQVKPTTAWPIAVLSSVCQAPLSVSYEFVKR